MTEFLTQIKDSLEAADIIVIVTAIISGGYAVYSAYKNSKFVETWNQKQLDADLKSKARIEWIQKVRDNTAELLSVYYKMLHETDENKLFGDLSNAKEKSELLILFFGPESNVSEDATLECLKNVESNDGKNEMLVKYISDLFEDFSKYYKGICDYTIGNLIKSRKIVNEEMIHNPVKMIPAGYYTTEDGEEIPQEEPVYDEDLQQEVWKYDRLIREYGLFNSNLTNKIEALRNYMRIYLKVEWNKAKEGK